MSNNKMMFLGFITFPVLAICPVLAIARDDYILTQYFFAFALVWLGIYVYNARRAYSNHIHNTVSIFKSKAFILTILAGFVPAIFYGTSFEVVSTPQADTPVIIEDFAMNQDEEGTITFSGSCDFEPRLGEGPKPFSFSSSIINIHKTAEVTAPMIAHAYEYHHRVYPLISYSTPYRGEICGYIIYLPE